MKKINYIFLPLLLLLFVFSTKENLKKKQILVVSYNVENLMDTIDNPNSDDNEFLPTSKKNWNSEKYFKKITLIADVISSINPKHFPDIIGLIEVENKQVLEDLIKCEKFKNKEMKIIHEETTDPRGIDVALLYNPKVFTYIAHSQIQLYTVDGEKYKTREILYVKGIVGKDTLYVFVNHWKSRSGGQNETELKRILAAQTLRNEIDKILNYNPIANILCLGDFNDTPVDKSLEKTLNASIDSIFSSNTELYNLTAFLTKKKKGTHSYKDNWFMLDNIIVSNNFLDKKNSIYAKNNAKILKNDKVLYYNSKANDSIPNKTYGGNNYYGGVSDHLPVYQYFNVKF